MCVCKCEWISSYIVEVITQWRVFTLLIDVVGIDTEMVRVIERRTDHNMCHRAYCMQ